MWVLGVGFGGFESAPKTTDPGRYQYVGITDK
jgi:hypothetical protein